MAEIHISYEQRHRTVSVSLEEIWQVTHIKQPTATVYF
jgi:hypothetical protein